MSAVLWESIVRLWGVYPPPGPGERLAVYFLQGLGCVPGEHTGALAREMAEDRTGLARDSVFLSECAAVTSAAAYLESAAVQMGRAPERPGRFREVRRKVLELLSKRYTVLLMGGSYGGLVASRVAESLADDPRAGSLHLRTFGSIYIAKGLPRTTNYAYVHDVIATLRTGLAPPAIPQGELCVYEPGTRTVWLRHVNFPDPAALPAAERDKAHAKIHGSYKALIMNEATLIRSADMDDPDTLEDLKAALVIDLQDERNKAERRALMRLMRGVVRGETDARGLAAAIGEMIVPNAYGDPEPQSLAALRAIRLEPDATTLTADQYGVLLSAFFVRGRRDGTDDAAILKMIDAVKPGVPYDAAFWDPVSRPRRRGLWTSAL